MIYHLDYETYSEADIKSVGGFRYAEDPSTRILMFAISSETEGPFIHVVKAYGSETCHDLYTDPRALEMLAEAFNNPESVIYAHNAAFEFAITRCRANDDLKLSPPETNQWRCTAAIARKAAIRDSLAGVSLDLDLVQKKDTKGTALIKLFSCPDEKTGRRTMPDENPVKFGEMVDYCLQDVRAEMEVHRRLILFDFKGDLLDTFHLDLELNMRGIPVNVSALSNAKRIVDDVEGRLGKEYRQITGLNPTQREKSLAWFVARGIGLPNMQGDTISLWLEERGKLPWDVEDLVWRALELYEALNYSAIKKIETMLACASPHDGHVRGTLLFHGAHTGRWSGRLIQPQNFKKPTIKDTALAYRMICDGCTADDLEILFGNPYEVLSSCVRHFIHKPGEEFLDADFNAIEARIVCWLAGQEDALERFRNKEDSYKLMASLVFNKPKEAVTSDERALGKTIVLGCGFQMGAPKFLATCHKNGLLWVTKDLAEVAVRSFREKYDRVQELWYDADMAARRAIASPGTEFKAGPLLTFRCSRIGQRKYLFMRLPSGRNIAYPEPEITPDSENAERANITFYAQLYQSQKWGRVKTYGGKLVENATQAVAADIMAGGFKVAEREGFRVFALIHDQALAIKLPTQTPDAFAKALSTLPPWAKGLPITAEAKVTPYYLK